jgi:hypothetical protein
MPRYREYRDETAIVQWDQGNHNVSGCANGIGKISRVWAYNPKELQRRQDRPDKIKQAITALAAEAQKKAQEAKQSKDTRKGNDSGTGAPPVEPAEKARRNFTDPDSRVMKDSATKSFAQCYNCQAAVDGEEQVIVAATLTQQGNDVGQVEAMLDVMESHLEGFAPGMALTLDAGYFRKYCRI